DGVALSIQRNVVARDVCCPIFFPNEIDQMTFVARMRSIGVAVIDARQRVLKRRCRFPWCANRSSVTALLNEGELLFQQLEKIAIIFSHRLVLHSLSFKICCGPCQTEITMSNPHALWRRHASSRANDRRNGNRFEWTLRDLSQT